ncbi:MAG: type 11 methyltransferase [Bacillales bacterium]|jgi:ubiquinone/menaquinone biosynthesis C-methylase UbiE|nr:type 11 methyltransferase [Bacillales bacterium]
MSKQFAKNYDKAMAPLERKYINAWRKELIHHTSGKVLEIGSGTGINFPLYTKCDEVIALEPNSHMIENSIVRKNNARVPIKIIQSKAEKLDFPDSYFDTVVITLVLCSVNDMEQVINECKRVLKPNGKLLILEHVKMEQSFLASLQHMLTPVWRRVADGCHLNRDPELLIRNAGFEIIVKKKYLSSLVVSLVAHKT